MKHYLIYQIRNKLNGMIYIGQHQTEDLDDDYMGSGLRIQRAIEKYGIDNFEKTILFECSSEEEMNKKEAEIVNEDFIARDDVYNITLGGKGGWSYVNKNHEIKSNNRKKYLNSLSIEEKRKHLKKFIATNYDKHLSKETRLKISISTKRRFKEHPDTNGMLGKKHSEESKQKMSKKHIGELNSCFGLMWICNDVTKESKRIKRGLEIPDGWHPGRFCK